MRLFNLQGFIRWPEMGIPIDTQHIPGGGVVWSQDCSPIRELAPGFGIEECVIRFHQDCSINKTASTYPAGMENKEAGEQAELQNAEAANNRRP